MCLLFTGFTKHIYPVDPFSRLGFMYHLEYRAFIDRSLEILGIYK